MGASGGATQVLPAWIWAGFPPLMLALLVLAALVAPEWIPAVTRSDHDPAGAGLAEHATVIVLVPGIAAGLQRSACVGGCRTGGWAGGS